MTSPEISLAPSRRRLLSGAVATGLGAALLGLPERAVAAPGAAPADSRKVTVRSKPYAVAAVSARSVHYDLAASLAKAEDVIKRAAAEGAALVAFGELWLPGYPREVNSDPNWVHNGLSAYQAQALTVGDRNWARLGRAARRAGAAVSIGYAEREGNHLFMGQALFGADGSTLIRRRKVRPSGSERAVFSDDPLGNNLAVVATDLGRVGALECWEHLHPMMTYNVLAQQEDVHIAAWPYNAAPGAEVQWWEDVQVASAAARMHAINGSCHVLVPAEDHAMIFNPLGQVVAESVPGQAVDYVLATVDPTQFTGEASDVEGENSWGVLQLLRKTYPGPRVRDEEHQSLNLITVPRT